MQLQTLTLNSLNNEPSLVSLSMDGYLYGTISATFTF